jgi:hypothetical protein
MRTSDHIDQIATALATAQGQIEDARKDSLNPHFKSRYADLAAVRSAIRGALSANGIAYTQAIRTLGNTVEVETMLVHKSGQYIAETLAMPLIKFTAQEVGSASSYGRRYGLMGLVGLAADDDDAEAATPTGPIPKVRSADDSRSVSKRMADDLIREVQLRKSPQSLARLIGLEQFVADRKTLDANDEARLEAAIQAHTGLLAQQPQETA